jgi:hypothetical protein
MDMRENPPKEKWYTRAMTDAAPLIDARYDNTSLQDFLIYKDRTKEDFEQEVMGAIWSFTIDHREKIAECIVSINEQYVHVTFHQHTVRYDDELQDASTQWEWKLAQNEGGNWPEVMSFLCPATSSENVDMMHGKHASGED